MSRVWWLVLLLGMPAVFYVGAAVKGTVGDFPLTPWYSVFPALVPALLIGPIEELGWRGLALPLLQRRFAPLWAALILGVVVAVWHIPAFFMSGTMQSGWALGPFLLGVVAISVILTAMFNASRGSLLVAFVFHAQMNGPAWPDAQPWDEYLFVVVAIIVVVVNRKKMLSRDAGATAVVLDEEQPVPSAGLIRPDADDRPLVTTARSATGRRGQS
jgi:membrane protease YdiL (CAAX protease family)